MSASPGGLGGLRGLVHARAILSNMKILVLPDQITLPNSHEAFNDDGSLISKRKASAITALSTKLVDTIVNLK